LVNIPKPAAAIFGGSFDPPHKGHQAIVQKAAATLDIDQLIVLPAYLNPFKTSSLASAQQRLQWCHLLFDEIPKVLVSDYESKEGKSTRTSQSVKHFNKNFDVKYLIIGSDNLSTLTQWHEFEWLNTHVTWVIVTREGYSINPDSLREYKVLTINEEANSTKIRELKDLEHVDTKIESSVKQILKGSYLMTIDERIENIVNTLDEKKAEEIEVFNLDDADYIADRVVIANSLNLKHTQALFTHLKEQLKPLGESFLHADASDEWVVADMGDILVHIMIPEYRQRYSLETFLSELVENQIKNKDIDPA
jgi:nicotinate-nucleotide adenylyltransferase